MRCALLLALTGCSSLFGLHEPSRASDAAVDTGTDGPPPDGQTCVGHGAFAVCFDALPTSTTAISGAIATDSNTACSTTAHWASAAQPSACMIVGTDVTESSNTTVTGSRPLVIVATGVLEITGTIDVSSHRTGAVGPGASPPCTFASTPVPSGNGGGGGAGGSFGSLGGNGGAGDSAQTAGGQALAVAAPTVLRGGCAGQSGATGSGGAPAGPPGDGGGAIYLAAGTRLTLSSSTIAADGAGGLAGTTRAGGSGGGAGGMIVLDAPTITASGAVLVANGGGGSSGADGTNGNDGFDPNPLNPTVPAPGGSNGKGGSGGFGAAGTTPAGAGADVGSGTTRGGGGGGGGGGVIYGPPGVAGITASPAIQMLP